MSTIRLQALPRFPASVEASDGIVVTRSNGVFTFAADSTQVLFASSLNGTANEIAVVNDDGEVTLSLPAALSFIGKTVTGGTYVSPGVTGGMGIAGGLNIASGGLSVTGGQIFGGSALTLGGAFTTSGASALTLTTTGTTNVTLPTSGTLLARLGSTTDNAIARYDGTTGLLQNSTVTVSDNGTISTVTAASTAAQGLYVEQIASGAPTDTNGFGYGLGAHFYSLSTRIVSTNLTAKIVNGGLFDVYPRTGSQANVIGVTGAVVIAPGESVVTTDPNQLDFVGGHFYSKSSSSLGGTNTGAGARGGIFGANAVAINDTTNILGTVGFEINIQTLSGSTQSRRAGIAIVPANATSQGALYDAGLSVSAASGNSVDLANGILFSDFNGAHPVGAAGKLIATQGSKTVACGIDFSSYTFGTAAFKSTGFQVDGSGNVTTAGQIVFPATQNASANANTLDDYEEGTWTPGLTFGTPGNLAVGYATQAGSYTKIGKLVTVTFNIIASSFTHTTASGDLTVTGLPFTCANVSSDRWRGTMQFGGVTKAGYTNFTVGPSSNTTNLVFIASGSAAAPATVTATDMPTGGSVVIQGSVTYMATN